MSSPYDLTSGPAAKLARERQWTASRTRPPESAGDGGFLSEREVSERFGIDVRTLQQWRLQRAVLPFVKFGRLVRYKRADLDDYAAKHTVATR